MVRGKRGPPDCEELQDSGPQAATPTASSRCRSQVGRGPRAWELTRQPENAPGRPTDPNAGLPAAGAGPRRAAPLPCSPAREPRPRRSLRVGSARGREGSHPRAPGLTLAARAAQAARRASAAACSSSCRACSSRTSSANSSTPCSRTPGTIVGCGASGGQAPRTVSCRERPTWEGGWPHSLQHHSPDTQPAEREAQGQCPPRVTQQAGQPPSRRNGGQGGTEASHLEG